MLHPALGSLAQESHGLVAASPEKGCRDDQRAGAPGRVWIVQPEMRRLVGDLTVLSVPRGASKRTGEGPFTRGCKGGMA